jgi:hypothetical protein
MKINHENSANHKFNPMILGTDLPDALVHELLARLTPPIFAEVDAEVFVRATVGCNSLSLGEKQRVLLAMPTLSQFQIDALMDVWRDETSEFVKLLKNEWEIICHLSAKTWHHAFMLADVYGVNYPREREQADRLTMLARKYNTPARQQQWVKRALVLNQSYLVQSVFGEGSKIAVNPPAALRISDVI